MISVIITAFKEEKTIKRAIMAFKGQINKDDEIIVIAPDIETLEVAEGLKVDGLRVIRDKGKGKPAALNMVVKKARGDILILSDGDVYVSSNAVTELVSKFKDKDVGAVSGRPISISDKETKYGYWAYLLTEIANSRRNKAIAINKRIFCSGYLFGIRKEIFPQLPENLLSEDGYISNSVYETKYKIEYAEKAEVYVKYPSNFSDWIKQKKRSAGGYNQIKAIKGVEIRSFRTESSGMMPFFNLVSNLKELFWLLELFISRVYLWILIFRDINIKKKSQEEIWQRVESTK